MLRATLELVSSATRNVKLLAHARDCGEAERVYDCDVVVLRQNQLLRINVADPKPTIVLHRGERVNLLRCHLRLSSGAFIRATLDCHSSVSMTHSFDDLTRTFN